MYCSLYLCVRRDGGGERKGLQSKTIIEVVSCRNGVFVAEASLHQTHTQIIWRLELRIMIFTLAFGQAVGEKKNPSSGYEFSPLSLFSPSYIRNEPKLISPYEFDKLFFFPVGNFLI